MITFIEAKIEDVNKVITMQTQCFIEFLNRYHDDTINPTNESAISIKNYIQDELSHIFFIKSENIEIGIIKFIEVKQNIYKIDDFGILPEYRNRHLGTKVILEIQNLFPFVHTWLLSTILEEERNIHFYEKLGFKRMNELKPMKINENMTIVDYKLEK